MGYGTYIHSNVLSTLPDVPTLAAFWVSVIFAVAECQVELVTQWPTNVPVSRNAARYIDGAAGFAVAWNFWLS